MKASTRSIVTSIEVTATGARLGSNAAGLSRTVAVWSTPDLDQARRWLRTFRRVGHIELRITRGTASCAVHAIGHRLPTTRKVSLAAGLGMGLLGVPVMLIEETG